MSVSADLLRLGLIREATPGVTPANPAFQILRVTSESLTYTPETQLSNELNPSRQVSDVIVSGASSGGDISFEISSNPGFETMLEGVLANTWDATAGTLWVGNRLLTHSIEKRFTLDPNAVDPLDQYDYHRIARALVDSMTLTFTPGGPATGSASIIAGPYTRDSSEITGATYEDPGKLPVFVGAQVVPITFTIDDLDYTAWCVSNLVVTFRNNGRAIMCLGQDSASEVVLGRFEAEITATVYVNAETKVAFDAFLGRDEIALSFTTADSLGNSYAFAFSRVRISAATEVTPGTNQDVLLNMTLQALVDTTTVTPTPLDAETCVLITRTHVTTPWPEGT